MPNSVQDDVLFAFRLFPHIRISTAVITEYYARHLFKWWSFFSIVKNPGFIVAPDNGYPAFTIRAENNSTTPTPCCAYSKSWKKSTKSNRYQKPPSPNCPKPSRSNRIHHKTTTTRSKYDKTNLGVLAIPRGFSPCGTNNSCMKT